MKQDVFDTRRHRNVKPAAAYRQMRAYCKGVEQYKAEKARRGCVLELHNQGLTAMQIAVRLNVSVRTVSRDLAKLKQYMKGQRARFASQADADALAGFDSLSQEQLENMPACREARMKRVALKVRRCKALLVTVDVDKALAGRCVAVKFKPDLPVELLDGGRITLQLQAQGRVQPVARIYVGKIASGSLNLQTNQSMDAFVVPALKGLRVVESED